MDEPTTTPKGVMTSEFWLTVLGVVAMVLLALLDKVDGSWVAGAIAAACFGYQASRTVVKKSVVGGDAQVANFRADLAGLAEMSGPVDEGEEAPVKEKAAPPSRARRPASR